MRKKIVIILLLFAFSGCTNKRENIYLKKGECSGFTEKVGIVEKEEGWIHVVEIFYML